MAITSPNAVRTTTRPWPAGFRLWYRKNTAGFNRFRTPLSASTSEAARLSFHDKVIPDDHEDLLRLDANHDIAIGSEAHG